MRYIRPLIVAAAAFALAQPVAFARGGGGMSGANPSPPAHSEAMANSNGPMSADRDFGRARAEDRMSANAGMNARANANSNGPRSADRDFGRARAEDRMSAQGKLHAKAKTKTTKKKVNTV